ncbi:MAG: hypothetical protein Q8M92_09660, partial [Candidatus Subteraquimicrobiales bacterium]|nr:hypothetical protein [Candidatus Subteraquimicrobiales bacterium]
GPLFGEWISEKNPAFIVMAGVPHAIPRSFTDTRECFSITNGPRQVEPLRSLGHKHVLVEVDLHPKTLGVSSIVESEFGAVLRSLA